ncbi:hypothetical protein DPMN_036533 [Dreissena polymorpha]|uniref:Uncharacterized protein n=1 Tax=Dreissena polymorpha TaxID=45954 RepID=A0A9D4RLJ3_DREPO|nr:hypothetical protein DPMN_036533 [Dreissena polymorpha]
MLFLLQAPHNVVQYTLEGNARALEYFQVSASSGIISLIKPVYQDTNNTNYVVRLCGRIFMSPTTIVGDILFLPCLLVCWFVCPNFYILQ